MSSVTFTAATGGDGSTVTDDSNASTGLANGGHRTRLIPAFTQIVNTAQKAVDVAATAVNAPGTQATSATSWTMVVESRAFTLAQSGKSFPIGGSVKIARTSDATKWAHGDITAFSDPTLTVNVTSLNGSGGPWTDWTISISGPTTAVGVTAGLAVQVDQAVTAWTRAATTTLGTSLNGTLSDTSTTITAFGGVAGVTYHCRALGAGSITHHATNLIITQTGASITTAAGDTFDVEALSATTCRIKNYMKADGTALVSSASGMTLLATLTPTAAAAVDALTTFSSTYNNYLIIGNGIKPASNDYLEMRFAVAGTVDAGSNYFPGTGAESLTAVTGSATYALVHGNPASVLAAGTGLNFYLFITNANDATNAKGVAGKSVYQSAATPAYTLGGGQAVYTAANAVSGVRFKWDAGGNFAAVGTIKIYGFQNS